MNTTFPNWRYGRAPRCDIREDAVSTSLLAADFNRVIAAAALDGVILLKPDSAWGKVITKRETTINLLGTSADLQQRASCWAVTHWWDQAGGEPIEVVGKEER